MLASKIITKDKFREFLGKMFINKTDVALLMSVFYLVKDVERLEKVMFALYNEYIAVDDVLSCLNVDTVEADNKIDTSELHTAISEKLDDMLKYYLSFYDKNSDNTWDKACYRYVREYFFRDYVTTLTFENYKDRQNMLDQLNVVWTALTNTERNFLSDILGIDSSTFSYLVRLQDEENNYTLNLADVEKSSRSQPELSGTFLGNLQSQRTEDYNDEYYLMTNHGPVSLTNISANNGDYCFVNEDGNYFGLNLHKFNYVYYDDGNWLKIPANLQIITSILNCTNTSDINYYYGEYSQRELLVSILNKISQGTIH